jgi:hypothetical protein
MRRVWNYFPYHGLCPPVAQLGASARHFHRSLRLPLPSVASTQFFFELNKIFLNNFFFDRSGGLQIVFFGSRFIDS